MGGILAGGATGIVVVTGDDKGSSDGHRLIAVNTSCKKIWSRNLGSSGVTTAQTYGSWPMFHHDPQLTGYAPSVASKP